MRATMLSSSVGAGSLAADRISGGMCVLMVGQAPIIASTHSCSLGVFLAAGYIYTPTIPYSFSQLFSLHASVYEYSRTRPL